MAINPPLLPNGMPVPFDNELFLLTRPNVEFEIDKIPDVPGGKVSTKGTLYLSNIRLVFVANKPVGNFYAMDMPLLYLHEERFNQPIFFANNITGKVYPVIPDGEHRALYSPHNFKIIFKEGGCGTFVPLFLNLLKVARQFQQQTPHPNSRPYNDPFPTSPPPTDEILRHAYVDPNDPTKIYLQQPHEAQPQLRRRNYTSVPSEEGQT